MTSFVFPGQGSQTTGMAKDFHDNFKIARLIFEEIEDYTEINLKKIIFNSDVKKLNLTQFTQISIFAASFAIFKTYSSETGLDVKNINVMMGHSLGEYTALACSNKIGLKECSMILKKRGEKKIIEIGPNKVLSGLIKRISNSFDITSIDKISDIK